MTTRVLLVVTLLWGCRSPEPMVPSGVCGNGYQEIGEECDDGGSSCRDGCDPECRLEAPELLVIDLNEEATGDPAGRFHWDGRAAPLPVETSCVPNSRGRMFVYVPPADGVLHFHRLAGVTGVVDVEASTCARLGAYVLPVRGGTRVHLRQESNGSIQLGATFFPESRPGDACDPTGTADYCAEYSVCDGGVCVADADRGCGVNVPLLELPAPDGAGITAIAGSTVVSSAHSFPASCARESDAQRIHRLVLPYRARVRARASGPAVHALAAGTGGCRAATFVERTCERRYPAEPIHADLGVVEAGAEIFFMVAGERAEYTLRVVADRLPSVGERCDPGDPRAPCPEGAACIASGIAHACVAGGDAGCGMGIGTIELEASRAGGVVQLTIDPALADLPRGYSCGSPFGDSAEHDRLFHLRMPFTARVTLSEHDDAGVAVHVGACDAPVTCESDLGELAEGTDLWVRVNSVDPLVLRILLERDLAEAEPCEPSRFTDRCPSGTSCASDGAGGFACIAGADLGCGAGSRVEPVETLPDGSGLFTGSTSTAIGHREMQVCDRRLGATLEVLHRWTAPADGALVARTTLSGSALLSVRSAACDTASTLACVGVDSRDPIRVEGVRAGDELYLALDAVPDGVDYELITTMESSELETPCGVEVCASDETCANASWRGLRCEPRSVPPSCGNAIVESGEGCDDGNALDGDGCTAECTLGGYACGG